MSKVDMFENDQYALIQTFSEILHSLEPLLKHTDKSSPTSPYHILEIL